jgi:hypothetical protein
LKAPPLLPPLLPPPSYEGEDVAGLLKRARFHIYSAKAMARWHYLVDTDKAFRAISKPYSGTVFSIYNAADTFLSWADEEIAAAEAMLAKGGPQPSNPEEARP